MSADLARTIVEWASIRAAIQGKLRRVERIREDELVQWLRARRRWLDESDALLAVRSVLHNARGDN